MLARYRMLRRAVVAFPAVVCAMLMAQSGSLAAPAAIAAPERSARTFPPYTLIRKDVLARTLATGETVRRERLTKEARDSQGRAYREMRIPSMDDPENTILDSILVEVSDPVANTWVRWNTETREATVTHMQPAPAQPRPPLPPSGNGRSFVQLVLMGRDGKPVPMQQKTEDLGTKTISGLECTGLLITETIPSGAQGNAETITVTREQWFSHELGIAVRWITSDPRWGVHTTEILGLDRGEPDPGLFRVPAGYRVKEEFLKSAN